MKENCSRCIHFTGRALINGRLTWGEYCAYPAYALDKPVFAQSELKECPALSGQETSNSVETSG